MEKITKQESAPSAPYCTLPVAAKALGLSLSTLKQMMHRAPRRGVPMPPRVRCGKAFLYPIEELSTWLYKHSPELRGETPAIAKEGE